MQALQASAAEFAGQQAAQGSTVAAAPAVDPLSQVAHPAGLPPSGTSPAPVVPAVVSDAPVVYVCVQTVARLRPNHQGVFWAGSIHDVQVIHLCRGR